MRGNFFWQSHRPYCVIWAVTKLCKPKNIIDNKKPWHPPPDNWISMNRRLGRFFHKVAMSIYVCICLSPFHVIYFEASHWSTWPVWGLWLVNPPSLPTTVGLWVALVSLNPTCTTLPDTSDLKKVFCRHLLCMIFVLVDVLQLVWSDVLSWNNKM